MFDPADLAHAVAVLRRGGIVAYPTDTLYGLAVDPRSPTAIARLFAVKGRSAGHAIPLIASSIDEAARVGRLTDRARRLADAFWPGPLTLVLTSTGEVGQGIPAEDGTVAVRVPDHPAARALAGALDGCVTATSANRSGSPPVASADEVRAAFGAAIDYVFDAGTSPGGPPSTIADVRDDAPRLVRAGAIEWDRVLRSLQ